MSLFFFFFFFQAEDGIRDLYVTGVQTCLFRSPGEVVTAVAAAAHERGPPLRHRAGILVRGGRGLGLAARRSVFLEQEGGEVAELVVAQPVLEHRGVWLLAVRILEEAEEPVTPHLVPDPRQLGAHGPAPSVDGVTAHAAQLAEEGAAVGRVGPPPVHPAAVQGRLGLLGEEQRLEAGDLPVTQTEVAHPGARQVAPRVPEPFRQPPRTYLVAEAVQGGPAEAHALEARDLVAAHAARLDDQAAAFREPRRVRRIQRAVAGSTVRFDRLQRAQGALHVGNRLVRGPLVIGGLTLAVMTDGATEALHRVGGEPGAGVGPEGSGYRRERGVVDPQVASRAAVDPAEVRKPDLAQAARAWRLGELVGVLHRGLDLPETDLETPPLGSPFPEEDPREDGQETQAEAREDEVQAGRRDLRITHCPSPWPGPGPVGAAQESADDREDGGDNHQDREDRVGEAALTGEPAPDPARTAVKVGEHNQGQHDQGGDEHPPDKRRVVHELLRAQEVPGGFFFSSRRRHTRSLRDWSSDVCSSDLVTACVPSSLSLVFEVRLLEVM